MLNAGLQQPLNRYPYAARYPQHRNTWKGPPAPPGMHGGLPNNRTPEPADRITSPSTHARSSLHSAELTFVASSRNSSLPTTIEQLLMPGDDQTPSHVPAVLAFNDNVSARADFGHGTSDDAATSRRSFGNHAAVRDDLSSATGSGASNTTNSDCLLALSEGKGNCRGELGLAALELIGCEIVLYHITDNISYDKSLALIEALQPGIVLLPDSVTGASSSTSYLSTGALNVLICTPQQQQHQTPENNRDCETQLATKIRDTFRSTGVAVRSVRRRFFNATEGLKTLRRCAVPSTLSALEVQLKSKTYCFAALAALIQYVEEQQRMMLASGSIMFRLKAVEDATVIDVISSRNLELLASAQPDGQSNRSSFSATSDFRRPEQRQQCCQSLYAALNCTQTRVGARLLRANIMQPPTNLEQIRTRLKSVKELMANEQLLGQVRSVLSKTVDVDRLINFLICTPHRETDSTAEYRIGCFISIKHVLMLVEPLRNALSQATSPLMQGFCLSLRDERFDAIIADVEKVVNYETLLVHGVLRMKMQKLFAVRPGLSGMLDICRRAFTECTSDMNKITEQLARQYDLPPLKLDYDEMRGFHIAMKASTGSTGRYGGRGRKSMTIAREYRHEDLPREFVKVSRTRNVYRFTTLQLMRCNSCARDTIIEAFRSSSQVLLPLLQTLRSNMACLYSLSEAIAQLDVMTGMVTACSTRYRKGECVLPKFSETCLALLQSRHPLLPPDAVVSNDVFASLAENTAILTGPNMSGKSTFLRQIALLQIMSQIGAPLPCEMAVVRVCDQIFTRFGSDDDLETNASSFAVEMREIDFILRNSTERSLIIIDELGRGTRADEAVGICFAVAERLAAKRAFVWFATHYAELSALAAMYTNIRNYHFQCSYTIVTPNGEEMNEQLPVDAEAGETMNDSASSVPSANLSTNHRLADGACTTHHYGIQMAAAMGLPRSVVAEARQLVRDVDKRFVIENLLEMELQNLQTRHGGRLANFIQGHLDEMLELQTSLAKRSATTGAVIAEQTQRLKRKHFDKLFALMQTVKRELGADVRNLQRGDDLRRQQRAASSSADDCSTNYRPEAVALPVVIAVPQHAPPAAGLPTNGGEESVEGLQNPAGPQAERAADAVSQRLSQLSFHHEAAKPTVIVGNFSSRVPPPSSQPKNYKPLFTTQQINNMFGADSSPSPPPTAISQKLKNENAVDNTATDVEVDNVAGFVNKRTNLPISVNDPQTSAADEDFFRFAPIVYDDMENENNRSCINQAFDMPRYANFTNLSNPVDEQAGNRPDDADSDDVSVLPYDDISSPSMRTCESPVIVSRRLAVGRASRMLPDAARMPPPDILARRSQFRPTSLPAIVSANIAGDAVTDSSMTARGIFYTTLMAQNDNPTQVLAVRKIGRKHPSYEARRNSITRAHACRKTASQSEKLLARSCSTSAASIAVRTESENVCATFQVQQQRHVQHQSVTRIGDAEHTIDIAENRRSTTAVVAADEQYDDDVQEVEEIETIYSATVIEKRTRIISRSTSNNSTLKRSLTGEPKSDLL